MTDQLKATCTYKCHPEVLAQALGVCVGRRACLELAVLCMRHVLYLRCKLMEAGLVVRIPNVHACDARSIERRRDGVTAGIGGRMG